MLAYINKLFLEHSLFYCNKIKRYYA